MPNYKVFKNASNAALGVSVSSTTTYYSESILVDGEAVSWHSEWTGTPTGAFTLWYSNKPNPDVADDDDWVEDTTFPAVDPAGAAGKSFITAALATAYRARLKYVNASGSGTLATWAQTANGRS